MQTPWQQNLEGRSSAGGQPGNSNALRHGFYSRKSDDLEVEDLNQVKGGLQDEIAMLRVSIRRVFDRATELGDEFAEKVPGSELFVLSQLLTKLGIATTRLAHMLRTQKFLDGGSDDPLEDLIGKILDDLKGEERGVYSARCWCTQSQPPRNRPAYSSLLPIHHNCHRFRDSRIS